MTNATTFLASLNPSPCTSDTKTYTPSHGRFPPDADLFPSRLVTFYLWPSRLVSDGCSLTGRSGVELQRFFASSASLPSSSGSSQPFPISSLLLRSWKSLRDADNTPIPSCNYTPCLLSLQEDFQESEGSCEDISFLC
ncbi:uncharacterized protein V6R79_019996 [Siganus canaliculatus]